MIRFQQNLYKASIVCAKYKTQKIRREESDLYQQLLTRFYEFKYNNRNIRQRQCEIKS